MSINLGLGRVVKLLERFGNPQKDYKVVHIAGTNGKGSVCSYITSVLQQNYQVGKFTTPHLVHVTDSITVNGTPVLPSIYTKIRSQLEKTNQDHGLGCTEFELLTCAAFQYFKQSKCNTCVIEVGLGGRLDATNVIPGSQKLACGITKIGLDHESILGDTLAKIAFEKAGIISDNVKLAVVDGSNDKEVIDVVAKQCEKVGSEMIISKPEIGKFIKTKSWGNIELDSMPLNGEYQIHNLGIALNILDKLNQTEFYDIDRKTLIKGIETVSWPGRLQNISITCSEKSKVKIPILLDGAHNGSAAIELSKYLKKQYGNAPLTFIIAITKGKTIKPLFEPLIRACDNVIITQFGPVDGMPWIKPTDAQALSQTIEQDYTKQVSCIPELTDLIEQLPEISRVHKRPIVVCGSLYLAGQLLAIDSRNASAP